MSVMKNFFSRNSGSIKTSETLTTNNNSTTTETEKQTSEAVVQVPKEEAMIQVITELIDQPEETKVISKRIRKEEKVTITTETFFEDVPLTTSPVVTSVKRSLKEEFDQFTLLLQTYCNRFPAARPDSPEFKSVLRIKSLISTVKIEKDMLL